MIERERFVITSEFEASLIFFQLFGGRQWNAGTLSPSTPSDRTSGGYNKSSTLAVHNQKPKKKSYTNLTQYKVDIQTSHSMR